MGRHSLFELTKHDAIAADIMVHSMYIQGALARRHAMSLRLRH